MKKPQIKVFNVKVTGYMTVAVLAETQDDAEERARDVAQFGDFQIDDTIPEEVGEDQISGVLRHADAVDYDLKNALKFAKATPFKPIPKKLLKIQD